MTRKERAKYLSQLIIPDLFDNKEACELRMNQETALRETIAELVQDSYIAVPVSLIKNMCKALSEFELTDEDCFDKIHDACVDIDAYCRDKLNEEESPSFDQFDDELEKQMNSSKILTDGFPIYVPDLTYIDTIGSVIIVYSDNTGGI